MDFPDKPHLVGFVKKHLISKSKSCLKDTFNFFTFTIRALQKGINSLPSSFRAKTERLVKYEMFATQSERLRADREVFPAWDLKAERLLNLE